MNRNLDVRITLRNDLSANWTRVNPVLLKGEAGIEIDTNKFKVGDGVTKWSELTYVAGESITVKAEDIEGLGSAATKDVGTASGNIPTLEADGKLPDGIIPSLAIGDVFEVSSETAMLALSKAQKGDIAIRTDVGQTFILSEDPYSTLENWKELRSPTSGVTSVNGKRGAVTLTTSDVAEGTNKYYIKATALADIKSSATTGTFAITDFKDNEKYLRSDDVYTLNGGNA